MTARKPRKPMTGMSLSDEKVAEYASRQEPFGVVPMLAKEVQSLRASQAKVVRALRRFAIVPSQNGLYAHCHLCARRWNTDMTEVHHPDCSLAEKHGGQP